MYSIKLRYRFWCVCHKPRDVAAPQLQLHIFMCRLIISPNFKFLTLMVSEFLLNWQRWSREHKACCQGQGPKKCKAKAKDNLSEDRPSRGQGQGPRIQVQVFSEKKRFSEKFFRRSEKKRS